MRKYFFTSHVWRFTKYYVFKEFAKIASFYCNKKK